MPIMLNDKEMQFPDGDVISINGEVFSLLPEGELFVIGSRLDDPAWLDCDVGHVAKLGQISAAILVGNWEGEGGLYLSNNLTEIILHFDESESFREIELTENCIHAISEEYLYRLVWNVDFRQGESGELFIRRISRVLHKLI